MNIYANKSSAIKLWLSEKGRKTHALNLYPELIESQWWDLEKLEDLQRRKLRTLLCSVAESVPYYSDLMKERGLDPKHMEPFHLLQRLPVLTKNMVRNNVPNLLSSDQYITRTKRRVSTGGSTGEPLQYYIDKISHSAQWAHIWRGWSVGGYTLGDNIGALTGGSVLPGKGFRKVIYGWLNNWLRMDAFRMNKHNARQFIEMMQAKKVRFLYGYANALLTLAELANDMGIKLQTTVFPTAEKLLPGARLMIEKQLGSAVFDTYGANDGGASAFECEKHCGLHVGMERCFVEVLGKDGSPVSNDDVGRLVLTDLDNLCFPFIRYEVGDKAMLVKDQCECGRGLIRLREIAGRLSDIIATPSGQFVHGEMFSHIIRKTVSNLVRRFQVVQDANDHVEIRMSIENGFTEAKIEEMKSLIRPLLPQMRIDIVITDNFVKKSGGKLRVVIPLEEFKALRKLEK